MTSLNRLAGGPTPAPAEQRRHQGGRPEASTLLPRAVELRVDPVRVVPVLLAAIAALSALSLGGQLLQHGLHADFPGLNTWIRYSDVDKEANLPAWFQATLLAVNALVLWTVADDSRLRADGWSRHWRLLALAFGYLSVDELTEIHEQAIVPIQTTLHLSGLFFFAWVLLAIPVVVVFGLMYVRFMRALALETARGLLGAAALYLGGAVCLEMVGGYLWSTIGQDTVLYSLEAACEEALEMLGMVAVLVTVARYALAKDPHTG